MDNFVENPGQFCCTAIKVKLREWFSFGAREISFKNQLDKYWKPEFIPTRLFMDFSKETIHFVNKYVHRVCSFWLVPECWAEHADYPIALWQCIWCCEASYLAPENSDTHFSHLMWIINKFAKLPFLKLFLLYPQILWITLWTTATTARKRQCWRGFQ